MESNASDMEVDCIVNEVTSSMFDYILPPESNVTNHTGPSTQEVVVIDDNIISRSPNVIKKFLL